MKKILLALTVMAAALSNVRATSIYSDNFQYPDGSIVANSGNAWINNSGTTLMDVTNNQLIITSTRAEDIEHIFPSVFATNGPVTALYSSFTFQMAGGNPTAGGAYLAHFTGTNTFGTPSGFRARLFVSTNGPAGPAPLGQYIMAIANSNLGNTNDAWPTPLTSNVVYTVVTRLVLATGASTLWINPTSESDPSVTSQEPLMPDSNNPTNGIVNISSYGFREAAGEGLDDRVDNLKIGTSFVDVAGANTAPSITGIGTQSIPENGATGPISFSVSDSESPASSLDLSNATSNASLITTNNIVFGGSGSSRTVTLTPTPGQQGTATITIFVSDGVNQSSVSFLLQVGFPSISTSPNIITYSNLPPATTTVTVGDAESTASGVTVSNSVSSVNQSLIASVNVTGSGATRTVTITPTVDQTGVATITLYARDPSFNLVQSSFIITVAPRIGVVLSEPFSYDDFAVPGNQSILLADLDGVTNSPWQSESGTAGQLQVTNGVGVITSSNSEDVAANMAFAPFETTNGVVLYTGFTINLTNLPTQHGDYFAHFKDTIGGSTFRDKIYVTKTNATDTVHCYRIGIANSANDVSVTYPMDCNTNVTYQVVTRYNTATAETVLWVNPVDETSTHVTATDVTTASFLTSYGLRETDGEGTIFMDNLSISTAFSDVSPPVAFSSVQIQLIGNNVQLTWSNSGLFFLQFATNVVGPYKYASNGLAPATSPATFSTTEQAKFYRSINVAP